MARFLNCVVAVLLIFFIAALLVIVTAVHMERIKRGAFDNEVHLQLNASVLVQKPLLWIRQALNKIFHFYTYFILIVYFLTFIPANPRILDHLTFAVRGRLPLLLLRMMAFGRTRLSWWKESV